MKRGVASEDSRIFSTRRIEALTDGVFAIAMTLLVLDLKVSDLGTAATSGQLLNAMFDRRESIISFVVSFLLLGTMWAVHMRQFEYIKHSDRHLTMINNIRLLIVVIIPLTTSIAGNYQSLVIGRVLLPLNFFILSLVSYYEWRYAVRDSTRLSDNLSKTIKVDAELRNRAILYSSFVVMVASIWIGELAFLILAFVPPMIIKWSHSKSTAV